MQKTISDRLVVNLSDINSIHKLYCHLVYLLKKQEGYNTRPIVILCIGSDRYTGDALGPLVGSYLIENTNCIVYGSLDTPVHAGNLVEIIGVIHECHDNPIIIAIDACLGKSNEIGNIEIWSGALEAGIAVGHKLPGVGNISIIGVVNTGGMTSFLELQSTPLSIVIKLSKIISAVLYPLVNSTEDF